MPGAGRVQKKLFSRLRSEITSACTGPGGDLAACLRALGGGKDATEVGSADVICGCLRVFYRQRMIHYKAVRAANMAADK